MEVTGRNNFIRTGESSDLVFWNLRFTEFEQEMISL